MPVTTLDPRTALIVVDLQHGIVSTQTTPPIADLVRQAAVLGHAFRSHRLPVILVNVDGTAPGRTEAPRRAPATIPPGWTDIVLELNRQPSDHLVTKRTWGAFTRTDLDAYLRAHGCTQVVIVGVATSAGVESTARQAHEHGYNVALAMDAMADRSAEAHENSIARIFPRLGEIGTTREIVAILDA